MKNGTFNKSLNEVENAARFFDDLRLSGVSKYSEAEMKELKALLEQPDVINDFVRIYLVNDEKSAADNIVDTAEVCVESPAAEYVEPAVGSIADVPRSQLPANCPAGTMPLGDNPPPKKISAAELAVAGKSFGTALRMLREYHQLDYKALEQTTLIPQPESIYDENGIAPWKKDLYGEELAEEKIIVEQMTSEADIQALDSKLEQASAQIAALQKEVEQLKKQQPDSI